MEINSFNKDIVFGDKVMVQLITESSFSKEIRILLKKGLEMRSHKTPYPIVVHLLEGAIDFGLHNETLHLKAGDIIALEGDVEHNLFATENSVVRLSISKFDKVERVENVAST